jgi:hypothetical protein
LALACVLWHTSVVIPAKIKITPWLCAAKKGGFSFLYFALLGYAQQRIQQFFLRKKQKPVLN